MTVEFDSNADSIFITNDSIYNNGVGINFNSGGSITHLYVLNNYITTSGSHSWGWPTRNGINFTNTFQLQAEIKHNRIISCADAGIAFYSSFVDSIYSLEIDSNIIANSGYFYGIGVPTLSYNPPTNNLGRLTFLGNSIYGNAQQGIYRYSMRDTTSNYCALCIPLPTLIGADYNTGITTVDGTLQGDTLSPYIIEFFRNTIADTSGYGEGEYFINRDTVFTDATGHATFSVPLVGNFLGQYITATSTSLVRWQTSEFSNDVIVNSISEINEQRKNGFVIFPNPAHNSFTLKNISFENPTGRTTENFQVQIVNLLGEIVYSEKLFGKNEYSIHTNLSSGIYFVKMNTEKGSVVKKLLVTKD